MRFGACQLELLVRKLVMNERQQRFTTCRMSFQKSILIALFTESTTLETCYVILISNISFTEETVPGNAVWFSYFSELTSLGCGDFGHSL